jgi:peptide methionine sulfoxide reductase MsrA
LGSLYRSELFYFSEEQNNIALKLIAAADKSKVFKKPVVTKVSKAGAFTQMKNTTNII